MFIYIWGPAVGYCFYCLSISSLEGFWNSSCRVLSGLFRLSISGLEEFSGSSGQALSGLSICQFQAWRDSGAPAVGYGLVFLSVCFGPRGMLGLQLTGVVWSFCLSNFWPRGILGLLPSGMVWSICVCQFRAPGGFWGSCCWILSGFFVC